MNRKAASTRRHFWKHLVRTVAAPADRPCFLLDELPALPEDDLLALVLKISDDAHFRVRDWQLTMTRPESAEVTVLGPWLTAEAWLLNQLDGLRPLSILAVELAQQQRWAETMARGFVREFALRLVRLNAAIPVNCPVPDNR